MQNICSMEITTNHSATPRAYMEIVFLIFIRVILMVPGVASFMCRF